MPKPVFCGLFFEMLMQFTDDQNNDNDRREKLAQAPDIRTGGMSSNSRDEE